MSTQMIRLADAQAAIRHVMEHYERDINAVRKAQAARAPGEEPIDPDGEEAMMLAAKLCKEGAERARHALATVPIFEAVDFAAARIVDKKWIPEKMHDDAETQAIRSVQQEIGKALDSAGMIETTKAKDLEPTQTKITLRFTAMRPMEARWEPPKGGEQE